jgi:TPP-dependent pyruvate/acetoin dehydrogenase alpha subunit
MPASDDLNIRLYRDLLRIRRVEEICADEYRTGSMRTPTHFGIGQEAVAVGVCAVLKTQDVVYTHHRSHTHYLAKGGNLIGLVGELMGREIGCSRGRGGSVHLVDRAVGFIGSSPILGHSGALAAGSALAFRMDRKPHVAVGFFGEAALEEGAAWETFNFASIHQLPVLFVCENNLYSTESPMSLRQAEGTDLCDRVRSFKVPAERMDGNDVHAVHEGAGRAVENIRAGHGPMFLECMTYRWREHVGPLFDHEANRTYRSREELEQWMERCPVKRAGAALVASGAATDGDLAAWLAETDAEVHAAVAEARQAPWPEPSTLFENVY